MDERINARWAELLHLPDHPEVSVFPDRTPRVTHADACPALDFTCPKCKYSLTGIDGRYCPECGIELEHEPVTVFSAAEISLVWAAALVLDRLQISNIIVTGSIDPFAQAFARRGSLPHVMVPFKFFHEAAEALEQEFTQRQFRPGERPPRKEEVPGWHCKQCDEENPASFDICWQCEGERPGRDASDR